MTALAIVGCGGAAAAAQAPLPATLTGPLSEAVPAARMVGQGRLTWFGFAAYDAALWAAPGLTQQEFERHPFGLQLTYLRSFKSQEIVRVSIDEMVRTGSLAPQEAQAFQPQLAALIPDVVPGDRLTGVHRPGRGALFYFNDRFVGGIADSRFSRSFFSIWLGAGTTQPGLRRALFGSTPP